MDLEEATRRTIKRYTTVYGGWDALPDVLAKSLISLCTGRGLLHLLPREAWGADLDRARLELIAVCLELQDETPNPETVYDLARLHPTDVVSLIR